MRKRIILLMLISIIVLDSITVLAIESDTVNDLYRLYAREEIAEEIEAYNEYLKLKKQYEDLEDEAYIVEQFNNYYSLAVETQISQIKEIDSKIEDIIERNADIEKSFEELISGDIDELIKLDRQYKVNLSEVSDYEVEKSKYQLTEKVEFNYEDLKEIERMIEQSEQDYIDANEDIIIGNIKDIQYPVEGTPTMLRGFGYTYDTTNGDYRYHSGIDISSSYGSAVYALFDGVIENTGIGVIDGYFITIDHGNGVKSYYANLGDFKCQKGDKVKQGDVIATVGTSAVNVVTPHLHLGLYLNYVSVNPNLLFEQ